MNVLITGANGFVGLALWHALQARDDMQVTGSMRTATGRVPPGGKLWTGRPLASTTDWSASREGVDCVVNAAARVHVLRERATDPLAEFRRVNVDGCLHLAHQAAQAGVRRFVQLSTVKVHGESSLPGRPFRADDAAAPQDPYSQSKLEAEVGLRALCAATGMELVIVRPPLVYGPRVGANFLRLLKAVHRRLPLPFGRVDNRRSLIYLGNLVDVLITCMTHPRAAGGTWLVADAETVSTRALIEGLARALKRRAWLLPVPVATLEALARLLGREPEMSRLLGSLEVDTTPILRELGWQAPVRLQDGLADTAYWYRASSTTTVARSAKTLTLRDGR